MRLRIRGQGLPAAIRGSRPGFDTPAGDLIGGIDAWRADGGTIARVALTDGASLNGNPESVLIDVRQAAEYAAGHVPGARNLELGSFRVGAPALPAGPIVVMCGHGERAASAASLLERAGYSDITVLNGGPTDWADAAGMPLVSGIGR